MLPFSLGGRGFSPCVNGGVLWALAPEERCRNLSGIGSTENLPFAEEYGQSSGLWTSLARTGLVWIYSTFICQSLASRMVQSWKPTCQIFIFWLCALRIWWELPPLMNCITFSRLVVELGVSKRWRWSGITTNSCRKYACRSR